MRQFGLVVFCLCLFQTVAAQGQSAVTEAAVARYIADAYNDPGPIAITVLKQFPNGTTGTGRISIAGTVTFNRSTYVETYGMDDALKAVGFTAEEIDYYGAELGVRSMLSPRRFLFRVYDVEHKAGQVLPFTADYQYKETATGFWFGLNSGALNIYGKRLEELGDLTHKGLLVGSPEFAAMLSTLEDAKAKHEAVIAKATADLEAELSGVTLFASMPVDTKEDPVRWSDRFQIETSAPTMRWIRADPNHLEFGVQGEATFLLAAHWYDQDRTPGEKLWVVLRGDLYLDKGTVRFRIGLSDRRGGFDDDHNTFRDEAFDGHEGFVSNEVRLGAVRTATPPPPVTIVWETARVSRNRTAQFDLSDGKCLSVETSRGKHLTLMLNADLPKKSSVTMPSTFVVAGPKQSAALWYDGAGSAEFRYRRYDKTAGAC